MKLTFVSAGLLLLLALSACAQPSAHIAQPVNREKLKPAQLPTRIPKVKGRKFYQKRLKKLVKHPEIENYFALTDEGIHFYADPEQKKAGNSEAFFYYEEAPIVAQLGQHFTSDTLISLYRSKGTQRWKAKDLRFPVIPSASAPTDSLPLAGVRIALDPGHLGGSMPMAIMEDKFVRTVINGDTLEINEGDLTLATAYLLRQQLERLGANVLLTREKRGHSAFDKTYAEWLKADLDSAIVQERANEEIDAYMAQKLQTTEDISFIFHRFFKYLDFRERARKINAFQADLALVIHYNVDAPNYMQREGTIFPLGEQNYSMTFIPGSFMKRELNEVQERVEFVRLLFANTLPLSQKFSEAVMEGYTEVLHVPAIEKENELPYLVHSSIYGESPGVYHRNLSLTRLIHCPMTYGESLCQDYKAEIKRLALRDLEVWEGFKVSSRVEEVSQVYFNAILTYFDCL